MEQQNIIDMIQKCLSLNEKIEQWVLDWCQHDPQQMQDADPALYGFAKYHFRRLYGFYVKWEVE